MSDTAPRMPALIEPLWKTADVAAYLQMSVRWVKSQIEKEEEKPGSGIPFQRIGGHSIRFNPEKVKAWAEGRSGGKVIALKRG